MDFAQPHYLLFCDAFFADRPTFDAPAAESVRSLGRWRFMLERLDGSERLEAADCEPCDHPDRIALLSVVRGLEALEQPSRVSLVTTSRYVSRGLKYGLNTWRESNYRWERFGEQKPIRNADLWQRVDHALQFHGVNCRLIQSELSLASNATVARNVELDESPEFLEELQENQKVVSALPDLSARADERLVARIFASKHDDVPHTNHSSIAAPTAYTSRTNCSKSKRWVAVVNWWNFVNAWLKWWRGRLQPRTALYGT